jgi:hypothetical protein
VKRPLLAPGAALLGASPAPVADVLIRADAVGQPDDTAEGLSRGVGGAACQQDRTAFGEGADRGDRLVDLVRDPRGDLDEWAEPAGLRQFLARGAVAAIDRGAFFGFDAPLVRVHAVSTESNSTLITPPPPPL